MKYFLEYFYNLDKTVDILAYQVRFAFNIPEWVIAFLVIASGIYSYWIYKKEADFVNPIYRYTMAGFRFLVYVFILLLLLQPILILDRMVEPKSNIAILIDTSESMGIIEESADVDYFKDLKSVLGDKVGGKPIEEANRTQIVQSILNSEKIDLLNSLGDKFSLHFFSFGKETKKLKIQWQNVDEKGNAIEKKPIVIAEAKENVTQIGAAQRDVLNYFKGQPLAGLVMLTDGGNNKGEDPEIVSQSLFLKKVPVFSVGIGFPESIDISIVDINIPELLFKDEEIAVEVRFKASSLEGVTVPVKISMGDHELPGKHEVVCKDGYFSKEFVIKPEKMGRFSLKVSVPQQDKEFFIDNNKLSKQVRVIDSKIRILIAVDNPSWEYRYLKGMLNTDDRIETKVYINKGDLRRAQHDPDFIYPFPKTREELNKNFDVIIFNNIPASAFNKELEAIQKFVSEDGGSFIMFAATSGTPGTYLNTPIQKMLPIEFKSINQNVKEDEAKEFTHPFKLRLTADGKYHNVTRLTPLVDENEKLWLTLPSHYWYYKGIKRLKPAAIALVEHSAAGNEHGAIPLITQQRYGKGQVLFFGVNSMWRWRFKIGNKHFNKYWAQTIQFMGLPHLLGTMERVQFTTEGKEFTEGQLVTTSVKIITKEFTPITDEEIVLIATDKEQGLSEQFKFASQKKKPGTYEGQLFLKKGSWDIVVERYEKEGDLKLKVTKAMLEFENPAMQKGLLRKLADHSGGKFIEIKDLANLRDHISEKIQKIRQQDEMKLWDNWFFILVITILASIEWALRKKADLP
ncbi:MAG: hypothetical protein COA79_07520 [Planctomycetota bacterium]|nr:MAG: hypothetical protein COA79_07520 [Planctomycetota bacterium]